MQFALFSHLPWPEERAPQGLLADFTEQAAAGEQLLDCEAGQMTKPPHGGAIRKHNGSAAPRRHWRAGASGGIIARQRPHFPGGTL